MKSSRWRWQLNQQQFLVGMKMAWSLVVLSKYQLIKLQISTLEHLPPEETWSMTIKQRTMAKSDLMAEPFFNPSISFVTPSNNNQNCDSKRLIVSRKELSKDEEMVGNSNWRTITGDRNRNPLGQTWFNAIVSRAFVLACVLLPHLIEFKFFRCWYNLIWLIWIRWWLEQNKKRTKRTSSDPCPGYLRLRGSFGWTTNDLIWSNT